MDLFTTVSSTKGNNELTYPIGLLNVDEVVYAGGAFNKKNQNYYLYDSNHIWTMSPSSFNSMASVYAIDSSGDIYENTVIGGAILYNASVRPVINLKSTVTLSKSLDNGCTEQNGTASCPYIIKTN